MSPGRVTFSEVLTSETGRSATQTRLRAPSADTSCGFCGDAGAGGSGIWRAALSNGRSGTDRLQAFRNLFLRCRNGNALRKWPAGRNRFQLWRLDVVVPAGFGDSGVVLPVSFGN